ncbi:MAG: hypothetical protein Ct9H300mP1_35180 [Planctomycetaceae bacterium]|nr:MAG: hypothetical protein Ct9H300mP1_35180 [Planctomycetaceae bacterium]
MTIDLIGRIPTAEEIAEYESLPPSTRQQKTVNGFWLMNGLPIAGPFSLLTC